ncbi:MAG: ABC transporter ATP-binding protein [Candidatus Paracaedibacteraceae bacterium]|nr:ABC transporter ATP-binding protein [Candidatus Paracaedibacteraceae bacterium]
MKTIISIRNVSKKYILHPDGTRGSFKEAIFKSFSKRRQTLHQELQEFWALKNVSFDVQAGEILGVLGHNGSGKSTLLKLLSRITAPSEGEIQINGSVRSLLEVGTGFHQELTGRENVYLSCAIYGLSQEKTSEVFDAILEFSGIGDFIDIPVKFYSSGMGVRLAFAVSTHVKADILLLDEIWAVGDMEFQHKSLKKMRELIESGVTVLMVTHEQAVIDEFCTRTIRLEKGQLTCI